MGTQSTFSSEASCDYMRRMYDRIIAWYEVADRKAQLILTLNGVFVSFIVGSTLSKPEELRAVTTRFGPETWLLLGLMTLALVASISSALRCLISCALPATATKTAPDVAESKPDPATARKPEEQVPWFFQHVAALTPEEFVHRVARVDASVEADTLARNAIPLASRVVQSTGWSILGSHSRGSP